MKVSTNAGRARDLLIVDDDVSQALLFKRLLQALGLPHRCHHASSGEEALNFLRRSHPYDNAARPELIILDVNMPGMDGCAVLREIKRDPQLRCIPVVMFSLACAREEIEQCYQERANAFVRKPVDYESSLRVVEEIERFWFHTAHLPPSAG